MIQTIMDLLRRKHSMAYSSLEYESEKDSESSSGLLSPKATETSKIRVWPFVLPWVVSTVTFAWAAGYFFLKSLPPTQSLEYSYSAGWKTDFGPARSAINLEEVRFTGGPMYSENGTYYVPHPASINYTADPSPELDRAWEELTWGRYIVLSEQEAKDAFEEQYEDIQQFWSPLRGGYISGFDMFHTLHCLDRIRQRFYPEYYVQEDLYTHRVHHLHCIEQVRQYIMCAGDMTPVPTIYNKARKHSYVDSDVTHTCRNFQQLRDWLSERYNGSLAVKPTCPGATKPEQGSTSCVLDE
ncbi:uncharacterized protein BHQ10_006701 [Talaromyces amestolkiae]|uniref:Tat pathway signal sequence n=1 Tax=Talaromyces amestolkiae TaxID=1196081 RepID=A0A364L4E8_TALAM|nr:uncharacterized protein BHQ10_006701 [Talaromyces amestolkiae]RAO70689.1 hypothetical protein BHQ10_006701 [Talaromyces amestolkiae]